MKLDKSDIKMKFEYRGLSIIALASLIVLFLYINIINLQVVEGSKYYLIATRTNQAKVKQVAPRGIIYDSTGKRVAYNTMAYSVFIKTTELDTVKEDELFGKLVAYLGGDAQEYKALYTQQAYDEDGVKRKDIRVTINSDIEYETYINLLSYAEDLKQYGVYFNSEPIRFYEFPNSLSNVIGYVGDPTAEDVKNGIYSESRVGKEGLERYYDSYLRGKEGIQVKEKDPLTGEYKIYTTQEIEVGNNLNLTIDGRWQAALYTLIKNRATEVNAFAGAGVIVNSKTGAVKAMVTYPGYNNNKFSMGISYTDYQELINDPRRPLFNRPISLQLPPGSTWKLIGATAALEGGVVTKDTIYYSNKCVELPGKINFCEADKVYFGNIDFNKALAVSSNLYFCDAAMKLNSKFGGPDFLLNFAKAYGLGEKTGIDLFGEAKGTVPSEELKKQIYNEPWYIGDDCNTIVGQGMDTVTPLQMATAVTAIVNDGEIMKPYLVSSITDDKGIVIKEFIPQISRKVEANLDTFATIRDGMKQVVEIGTASALKDSPGNIIAKTGSSDASEIINGKRYSGAHSWTVGCFDFEGENYCFTVMLQWGGRGYKSVTVVKNFINCLYSNFNGYCID